MKASIKKPVLVFFGAVFLLSAGIIFVRDIHLPQIPYLKPKSADKTVTQPKMANLQIKNGKIIIKYSELDLFMTACCSSIVKNTESKKDGGSVKLTGQATFPFSANFEGKMIPYAESEKIRFRLTDVVLGKVESPEMLTDKLGDLISRGFEDKINSKYKAKDVKIEKEGIEILLVD